MKRLFRKKIFYGLLLAGGLLLPFTSFSQSAFLTLGSESYHDLDRMEILAGKISDELHLSALPVTRLNVIRFLDSSGMRAADADSIFHLSAVDQKNIDYLLTDNDEWSDDSISKSKKPFLKYFYRNKSDLYQFRSNDFMVKINPVFDFGVGTESAPNEGLYTNTRGIDVRGWVSKKVGYYFFLTENQARYPLYVQQRTDSFGAVPYQGYYKNFKTDGVDFLDSKGYVDFTAAKFINFQFGLDKNFIGNGIRTFALSDVSEDYLFLKIRTQVWKINYQNLFMDLTADFLRGGDTLLPAKYATLNNLSINATRWLNVGVWESVVFHRNDGYELQYLNPIIFIRTVEAMLGSPDNTMLGVDYHANFLHHFSYYGQLMIDDYNFQVSKGSQGYWGNKYGIQQGLKYIDAFDLKNLDLQFEWNMLRPYSFTHNDTIANYSNYNQPLAHPFGANFNEWIGVIRYQPIFPLMITAKLDYGIQGRDTSGSNYGANIFIPTTEANVSGEYGNEVGQGVKSHLFYFALDASFMVRHNLYVYGKYTFRQTTSDEPAYSSHSNIFQVGIRMNLWRNDYDW